MSYAIVGAVIMGGLSAYQIKQQNEAIADQQESIAATTKMNYALKQQQEAEAKTQAGMELSNEAIKRFQERGAVRAAQAESGVAGASPLRELANTYLQESLTAGTIISKSEAEQRSLALQNQSTYLQGLSQINALDAQYTTGFDAALQIGISAGAGYMMGGAAGGAGASSGAGAGTLTAPSGEMALMSAGETAAMGSVPAGYTFTTLGGSQFAAGSALGASSGSLFGMSNATAFQTGMGLYSSKSTFGR